MFRGGVCDESHTQSEATALDACLVTAELSNTGSKSTLEWLFWLKWFSAVL